ncbi:hypothetical protein B0J11DRAFT_542524 [Dendryphion nanum]|uniref:Uncharacterized protein n=1 Tax=Dendryphion nanum TaxID=256645 RepID=A0A9P9IAG5_9PLEO|nr:hypothetical protein B0J11DRAFT_542524 [Dendryphion nanum]
MTAENLYVVKRTIFNPNTPFEPSFDVALPATFTDLRAAKIEAENTLVKEGYEARFFSVYDVNDGSKEWKHGDGVIVYAKGPSQELLKVEIDTVPNLLRLGSGADGRIEPPLHHVLQTIIEYDNDRSGTQRYSIIEGTYTNPTVAREQALGALLGNGTKKEDFVQYDEFTDGDAPFGSDVVVHAVKEGGQNVLVAVISDR